MTEIKEAIEKIKIVLDMIRCPHKEDVDNCGFCKRTSLLNQAIAKLRTVQEQPETELKLHPNKKGREDCEGCPYPERHCGNCINGKRKRPPAGDFTKECRELRKKGATAEQLEYATKLGEACDIIDQQSAQLKAKDELLFAYESVRAPKQPLAGEPISSERQNEILFEANRNIKARLDRSEASRKELLTACENLKKIYIEGSGNTSWMANYSDMEAAIKSNKKISGKK